MNVPLAPERLTDVDEAKQERLVCDGPKVGIATPASYFDQDLEYCAREAIRIALGPFELFRLN